MVGPTRNLDFHVVSGISAFGAEPQREWAPSKQGTWMVLFPSPGKEEHGGGPGETWGMTQLGKEQ